MKNNNEYIEGGTVIATTTNGKLDYIHPANKKYLESLKTPKSLDRINSDTVSGAKPLSASHAGFTQPKKIEETKSSRAEQLERLVLMQGEETRLVKQLERTRGVIQHIKDWLQDN